MTQEPIYGIKAFNWSSKTRVFSQEAWNLNWMDDEEVIRAFPNMKDPFYIKNYQTGEQRLFRFVEILDCGDWLFENEEDNITCIITVLPF